MQNPPTGLFSIASLQRVAYLLDDQFRVPFTRYRLGWDFILGLIPVAGDLLTAVMSLFILIAARKYHIKGSVMWKMLGNIVVDFLIGLIPVVGDVLDAGYKSNAMNVKLLLAAIEEQNPGLFQR
ncbi:MAG: DUF4112 domain-containing protein [Pseudomonadota bacterium]|nr:DUF4112 domain-containing protein [Pseudomonadota bacterium]